MESIQKIKEKGPYMASTPTNLQLHITKKGIEQGLEGASKIFEEIKAFLVNEKSYLSYGGSGVGVIVKIIGGLDFLNEKELIEICHRLNKCGIIERGVKKGHENDLRERFLKKLKFRLEELGINYSLQKVTNFIEIPLPSKQKSSRFL